MAGATGAVGGNDVATRRKFDLISYSGILIVMMICVIPAIKLAGASRPEPVKLPSDPVMDVQVAINTVRIQNLEKQLDLVASEFRSARVQERLVALESSVSEIKWMLRSLITAVAGELVRRLAKMLMARREKRPADEESNGT